MKRNLFFLSCIVLLLAYVGNIYGQPTISSFSPVYGKYGDIVTINGTNFNTIAANNIVYFGSTKATVQSATATQLSLEIPGCAKFGNLSVTNTSTHLTGYSSGLFFPVFDGNGNNTLTISKAQNITVPLAQWFVKLADIDGDGKVELLAMNQEGNVRIYPNNSTTANPGFNGTGVVTLTDVQYNKSMVLADLDGDGKLDIITSGASYKTNVYLNTSTPGNLSFASRLNINTDADCDFGFAVADIDMDGKPDIIYFTSGYALKVQRNTSSAGSISFASAVSITTSSQGSTRAAYPADVNGDGKPDIILGSGGKKVEILTNTSTPGSISFSSWGLLTATNNNCAFAYACDFDGDGNLDVISSSSNSSGSNNISVWRNTTSGGTISFAAEQIFSIGSDGNVEQLSFADMNGDNKIDVVCGNYGMYHKWMRNTSSSGSINFSVVNNLNAGGFYNGDRRIEAGDIDGDGRPDYVGADGVSNIYVFKNGSSIVSPPDAGITAFTAPTNPGCSGSQYVDVTLKNYSLNTLTSVMIDWSVNGVSQTQKNLTSQSIAGGAIASVNLGNYNFSAGTSYTIVATTTLPNGVTDNDATNDGYTLSNITINSYPSANAGTNQIIISGQSATLTATGGSTYHWSSGDNTASTVVNPANTTVYTVTVTNGNCSATDQITVTVNKSNIWSAGAHSNNWNNPSNWAGNTVPNSSIDAGIPANPSGGNFFPTVNITNASCKNLTIAAGGSLNIPSGNTLTISGYLDNSGNSNLGQGTISFAGTDYQSIYGNNDFYNLIINNSNGVGLSGSSTISNILKLTSGYLSTWGGDLTLLSTSSKTAIISGTGSGYISGLISAQRFLGTSGGYHYITSPMQYDDFENIDANMTVTGWGTSYKSGEWSNVWKYNETDISQIQHPDGARMNGWIAPASKYESIQAMEGLAIYTNPNTSISFNGTPNSGQLNINVTNTSSLSTGGNSSDDGWNFVGNPFPCTIDWEAASGWTKTNVDNAIYTYEPTDKFSGNYKSFVNGIGNPSNVTALIAPMQGFFVHANADGMLGMNNFVRVDNTSVNFLKKKEEKQLMKLSANNKLTPDKTDEATVYFQDDATLAYNNRFDAFKLFNTDETFPNLYMESSDNQKLSIYAIPPNNNLIVPLILKINMPGTYNINAFEINNFPDYTDIYLINLQDNGIQNLSKNPIFTFTTNEQQTPDNEYKFYLRFIKTKSTGINELDNNSMIFTNVLKNTLEVTYNNSLNKAASLQIFNILGQQATTNQNIINGIYKFNLEHGIYIVRLTTDNKTYTRKILVQ